MNDLEDKTTTTKLWTPIVKIFCIVAVLAIAGAFIFYLNTSNHSSSTTTAANPYEVSLSQISNNLQSGSLLIDVRTPEEYTAQHAKGAINIPLANIQEGQTPAITKDTIVYVYCHSGTRAAQAKVLLEKDGYQHVISLGGIERWIALGGQVVSSENK